MRVDFSMLEVLERPCVSSDQLLWAAINSNLFIQHNLYFRSAPLNIESCIFVFSLSNRRSCSSEKLFIGYSVMYKVWKLTNSVLILLFLFLFLEIWTLQVHPPFSMFLYWNTLLSVLNYTMFYVLYTTLLPILLYLYDTFTEWFLHTLVSNHPKNPLLFDALFFFNDSNLVECSLKVIFSSNPSSIPSNLNVSNQLGWVVFSASFSRLSDTSSKLKVLLNFKVIQLIASSIDFSFTPNTFPEWYLSVFLIYHIKGAVSNLRQFFGNINPFKVLCLLKFLKNKIYPSCIKSLLIVIWLNIISQKEKNFTMERRPLI